jgi:hypothetical protein
MNNQEKPATDPRDFNDAAGIDIDEGTTCYTYAWAPKNGTRDSTVAIAFTMATSRFLIETSPQSARVIAARLIMAAEKADALAEDEKDNQDNPT